jgi:hypothetical protein
MPPLIRLIQARSGRPWMRYLSIFHPVPHLGLKLDDVEQTKALCEAFERCQIKAQIANCKVSIGNEDDAVSQDVLAIVLPDEGLVLDREGNSGWAAILQRWHGKVMHCFPDLRGMPASVEENHALPTSLSVSPQNQQAFNTFVAHAVSFLQAHWLAIATPTSAFHHKGSRL